MCPPASIPPRLDINVSSTDEEVLLFLGGRKAGDPVPSNIITEVNPFSVEPWDSPEGMFYLYNFEDGRSSNQRNTFKARQIGYWRFMDHLTIYRGNVAAGRKTTWEFYIGQEPLGNRTGWLMYDYQRVQKSCQGISNEQDSNSMCRVFLQKDERAIIGDKKPPHTEHCSPVSSDNADGEHVESMLLRFSEPEESSSPTDAANQSEFGAPEQRHDRIIQDLATSDSASYLNAFVDISKGEYLELQDLYDLESTSSSSDDSSLISGNSDECFDAEALLRDIENENSRNIKVEVLNPRFNVASSAKQSHAAIKPSHSADSNKMNSRHSLNDERVLPKSSSPGTSASGSCLHAHPKRTHSGRSESSSSSNGSGSKSVARITKLGKKCCCFAPF